MKTKRPFYFKALTITAYLVIGLIGIFLWMFGTAFIGPFPYQNQPIPEDLAVEIVDFEDEAGTDLKGWLVAGEAGKGIVLVLHGLGGHKSRSLGRVKFLNRAGYTVFVFDFQGHGQSQIKNVTVGYEEARNVRAALAFLRSRMPQEKIAIIGPSLGGSAVLVKGQVIEADAYIFEGVYTSLRQTGENRLAAFLGSGVSSWLAPVLVFQTQLRLGFDAGLLSPIETISGLKAPILIIGGDKDPFVKPEETQALYNKAPEPKELWIIEGAGHFDFFLFKPEEYERKVLDFLGRRLQGRAEAK